MEYAILRSLRALGPGLVLLFYFDLFMVSALQRGGLVWGWDTARILLVAYVLGGAYGALTSRLPKEKFAFEGVQDALIASLDRIYPGLSERPWKSIAPCFYRLIDTDPSLKHKSQGVQFNGLLVTSSYDALWISFAASIVGAAVAIRTSGWTFLLVSFSMVILACLVWRASLRRHIELGDAQVQVIAARFSAEFSSCVDKAGASMAQGPEH